MSLVVTTGAMCMCSFGTTPGNLTSTNNMTVLAEGKPVLVITDATPMVNISSCGMCSSLANPQVAAATAAAMGVLTPQPCIPATTAWTGGTVLVGGKPCVTLDSKCMCSYAGVINITNPGQTKVIAG